MKMKQNFCMQAFLIMDKKNLLTSMPFFFILLYIFSLDFRSSARALTNQTTFFSSRDIFLHFKLYTFFLKKFCIYALMMTSYLEHFINSFNLSNTNSSLNVCLILKLKPGTSCQYFFQLTFHDFLIGSF